MYTSVTLLITVPHIPKTFPEKVMKEVHDYTVEIIWDELKWDAKFGEDESWKGGTWFMRWDEDGLEEVLGSDLDAGMYDMVIELGWIPDQSHVKTNQVAYTVEVLDKDANHLETFDINPWDND